MFTTLADYVKKQAENGFSVSLRGIVPNSGYMVAFYGHELKLDHIPDENELQEYVSAHYNVLSQDSVYLGGWLDNGLFYLDVSENIQDREQAYNLAIERKQLAIFSLDSFETIYIK